MSERPTNSSTLSLLGKDKDKDKTSFKSTSSTPSSSSSKQRRSSIASTPNTARRITNPLETTYAKKWLRSMKDNRNHRHNPLFTLLAAVAAAYFLTAAAGTCPSTASRAMVNRAQCSLGVVFAIVFGLASLASGVGIIKHGITPSKET